MANKHGSLSIDSENLFPIIKKWLYSDHDIFYRVVFFLFCLIMPYSGQVWV